MINAPHPGKPLARHFGSVLCISTMVLVTSPAAIAQATSRSLPNELFGIRLGRIYQVFPTNDAHNLPVAMVTAVQYNFAAGANFFFKPEVEEPLLPYMEHRVNSKQKHFSTSHNAYLLPMFPATLKSMDEIQLLQVLDVEALLIEWNGINDGGTHETNYAWAVETCKTYRLKFGIEPTVLVGPNRAEKQYECKFADGQREFRITGGEGKTVALSFAEGIMNEKHKPLESLVIRLMTPGKNSPSR